MGLLSKASEFTKESKLPFSEFILKNNVEIFAIFELDNNHYQIMNSIGFDGSSLLSSNSSADFWNGICVKENEIYNFNIIQKKENPLLQFFSFKIKDNIKSISLYKDHKYIYMLCNKTLTDNIINDIKNITNEKEKINIDKITSLINEKLKLLELEINFSDAISDFMTMKSKKTTDYKNIKQVLFNELFNRLNCQIAKYSTKNLSNYTVRTLISVDKSIHEKHIESHLIYNLKEVLDNAAKNISFNNLGTADSISEIKDFFQAE